MFILVLGHLTIVKLDSVYINSADINSTHLTYCQYLVSVGGRRGRDRMVVGFTTTYAISAYHH